MIKPFYMMYPLRRITPIFLLALCLLVCVSSCERRPLREPSGGTALVPFRIDWSKSGLDPATINRASIWFFPHDGSTSFEWRLQGDLSNATVPLTAGKYAIVVFNETIDETDWNHIAFEGKEKYATFNVYATVGTFTGLLSRTAKKDVRNTPEALAWWSMDEFEVTTDMIAYTRGQATKSDAVSKPLDALATITPLPLTVGMHVQAYVKNLKSATLCSAALEGATGKVSLATGRPIKGAVTHIFIMNNRQYDAENPLNGTIEARFLLFKFVEEPVQYQLQLDFKLHDGTMTPPELFDVTDQIDKEKATLNVNIGVSESEPEKDHPIVLPMIDIGSDVGVDDWSKNNVDIPIH